MNKHALLKALKVGRQLITNPENWTTGTCARDKNGVGVDSLGPTACKWCTMGAVIRVAPTHAREIEAVLDEFMDGNYVVFNDSHSHAEVLAAWDKAIKNVLETRSN